ncbi:hypothetical protein NL676_032569 [Syzygium grande]|nr:hypothetical protein NL676_032569 [Syzygium grande]
MYSQKGRQRVAASQLLFLQSRAHRVATLPHSTAPIATTCAGELTRPWEKSICKRQKRHALQKEVKGDDGKGSRKCKEACRRHYLSLRESVFSFSSLDYTRD